MTADNAGVKLRPVGSEPIPHAVSAGGDFEVGDVEVATPSPAKCSSDVSGPVASDVATDGFEIASVSSAKAAAESTFDYVVVGAGATGATAAAGLVKALQGQGHTVLVLEGGRDKQVLTSHIPAEHALASEDPDLLTDTDRDGKGDGYWVKHFDDPNAAKMDPKANERGEIWKPRGAGYGGSTRMNAMVFSRVDDSDWDALATATGDPAFRAGNMTPLLEQLTNVEYRPVLRALHRLGQMFHLKALQNLGGHGFDGPLEITRADPKLLALDPQLAKIALRGMWWSLSRLGTPIEKLKRLATMFDPNDNLAQRTEGPSLLPTSITKEGRRNGARDILLSAAQEHPKQLTLRDNARVKHLVLDAGRRCTGVVYVDAQGKEHTVRVGREAIIAAGAFETPALLMRSGIDLPGIGKSQGYRSEVGVVVRLKQPLAALQSVSLPAQPGDPIFDRWYAGKGGPLATNGAVMSFQMRSDPSLPDSDVTVLALPGMFRGYKPGYSEEITDDPHLMTFLVLAENKGALKGTVQLNPADPFGAPIIDHHFHENAGDTKPVIAGIKAVRDLIATQLGGMIEREEWPGSSVQSDAELDAAIKAEDWDHHPRGGAQMGSPSDPNAVVDSDFRVLGTTGLRVIDASVLPNNIGDFIVSGLYQIGQLAAQKIAADAACEPQAAARFNALSIQTQPPPTSLRDARRTTNEAATAAKRSRLISPRQAERLCDGTVSKVDIEVAWAAIAETLPDGKGSDPHTLAHNLLLAITRQLDRQTRLQTSAETIKDKVLG